MRHRSLRAREATVLLAGVVLAAATACGGDEPDPPLSLDNATATPDPQIEETPDAESSPTIEDQQEAAIEAVRAWIEASNEASHTLDPEPMLALSTPDCESCLGLTDWLQEMQEDGEQPEGDFEHQIVSAEPEDPAEVSPLILTIRAGDWQVVAEDGTIVATYTAEEWTATYAVELEEGQWLVAEVY